MSEWDGQARDEAVPENDAGVPVVAEPGITAGALLKCAREAAGLHIAALAVSLKVPVKKLEALESDRFDLLPDAVFVRALAASVCRTLKLDATEVLALLPQTGKPRLDHQRTSINTPFRSPSDGPGPSVWAQVSKPAVLAGLLLVLGTLVLIFLPFVQQQYKAAQPISEPLGGASTLGSQASTSQSGVSMASVELVESAKIVPSIPADVTNSVSSVPLAVAPAPVPTASPNLPPVTGPAQAQQSAAPASAPVAATAQANGIIVFQAKGESWVEVTDAKGVVVLRRTLTSGETASASGSLPLAAVVGRADATQVQVRGKAFDLSAVSKDNVARFEVK
ncbi:MAG TPA: helix-turn-helix domain-containing protein [Polaromonas sp.]|uniref:helix-turn-helix domain-containing protein n=1 Tax=Polaromonas sp. TaxID=1869339 RepID=UPI002D3BBCE7|nr:helix-turn-helix domain-containing protein [Polaromonas sp.]HYW57893.1 helix-turn-helix domain-containing protein [Polaromonas sp.]